MRLTCVLALISLAIPTAINADNCASCQQVAVNQTASVAVVRQIIQQPLFSYHYVDSQYAQGGLSDEQIDRIAEAVMLKLQAAGQVTPLANSSATEELHVRVAKTLGTNCMTCHSGTTAKAGLMMFDDKGNLQSGLPWWKIWDRIERDDDKHMPPAPRKRLSVNDIADVRETARKAESVAKKAQK